MLRVMIIGQPGAGKSTMARQVADCLGLPVVHIDHIHWQAGWVERPRDDKTRMCLEVEAGPAWVFEGGHSATWDNRMARAEMVIWLDRPLALRLWRVVKRSVVWRGKRRPDMPKGCVERFGPETLPFWHYIWRTRITGRAAMARLMARVPADKRAVHLCSASDIRAVDLHPEVTQLGT